MIHVAKILPVPSTPGHLPRDLPGTGIRAPWCPCAQGRVKVWEEFPGQAPHPSPLARIIVPEHMRGLHWRVG